MAFLCLLVIANLIVRYRRLGHSRVSTTQDIYCHLLEQADDTARDAIGSVLFSEKK